MSRVKKSQQVEIVEDTDTESVVAAEEIAGDVDTLVDFGVNVADLRKLKAAGIYTITGIQMCTRKKLIALKGLSEAKIDKIREAVAKAVPLKFKTAYEQSLRRASVFKVSTGSSDLDRLLGGGIESMSITEAFGEFRCGKTQLSHTLCVTCQLASEGSAGGKAIFIDTENTFRPERLKQIAERFELDEKSALDNVLYMRAYTSEHQYEILEHTTELLFESKNSIKLIVVDSVMALFRVDFSGRGELADRQQKLAQFLTRLQKLSEEYNLAVFITNQMTADPGAAMSFQADPKKPIGGHILAHASTTRIALRKGRAENRIAKIYDSPDMPESEATFAITEGGITDSKDA
ncbi:meiotic recombination protein DMC1/LIM15 homolog [Panonychus citri]|uniref:meiotic recombination protein DMC1/LIM15 homolog n=1 Tax=Panonychus citri TaxID=50023 RepID=UPI002307FA39|nr:meiotic recombination protein DMC1/LIM15 homolog [Panonychus citri]